MSKTYRLYVFTLLLVSTVQGCASKAQSAVSAPVEERPRHAAQMPVGQCFDEPEPTPAPAPSCTDPTR